MKVLILLCFIIPISLVAQYSGGNGTSGNPWQIANVNDLINLSKNTAHWGNDFIQTADISFNADEQAVDWDGDGSATWDAEDQLGFSPIGNNSNPFFGAYNGQEFNISNLFINRPNQDYVGFFGYGQSGGGTVQNIGLINLSIIGQDNVGGFFGADTETITNCFASGTIEGRDNVGGFVGANFIGDISNSYSNVTVNGRNAVGGFCGNAYNIPGLSISNCYSIGNVIATGNNVGGFIGSNTQNDISNCFARVNVTAINSNNVGGFVGYTISASIDNCYCTGSISGISNTGGFSGSSDDPNLINNSFWDTQTSGLLMSDGGTGKISSEMKSQQTFIDAGWDFLNENDNGSLNIWGINLTDNNSYPFLYFQGYNNKIFNFSNTSISNISQNSAILSIDVILSNNDPTIIETGFVYKVAEKPKFFDSKVFNHGSWNNETFNITKNLTSLNQSQIYFVRPYIKTDNNYIYYGSPTSFSTIPTLGEWGLIALGSLFALVGGWFVWRRMFVSYL